VSERESWRWAAPGAGSRSHQRAGSTERARERGKTRVEQTHPDRGWSWWGALRHVVPTLRASERAAAAAGLAPPAGRSAVSRSAAAVGAIRRPKQAAMHLSAVLLAVLLAVGLGRAQRREGGLRVGQSDRNTTPRPQPTTPRTTPPTAAPVREQLFTGLLVPHTAFGQREYSKAIKSAMTVLQRSRGPKFEFLNRYQFGFDNIKQDMLGMTPSPTGRTFLCYPHLSYSIRVRCHTRTNWEKFEKSS